MDLGVFLEPTINLPRIAHILDGLGHAGRVDTIRGWDEATMKALWEKAKGFHPLKLEDFVPASVAAYTEVLHEGKNSLGVFTSVMKRMIRSKDGVILGFNDVDVQTLVGPGYYVVRPWEPDGKDTGEVAVDYRTLPPEALDAWPPIVPNSDRLGRFVWNDLVDVMRGISKHVTIGRARKYGKWLNAWFTVARLDPG
jgi:hypothetical protein